MVWIIVLCVWHTCVCTLAYAALDYIIFNVIFLALARHMSGAALLGDGTLVIGCCFHSLLHTVTL